MATIYRRKGSRFFTIQYFDHDGTRRKVTTKTAERRVAERIKAGIEEQIALRRAGLVDPRAESLAFHASRPIEEHVVAWLADVAARGRTRLHVSELGVSLRRVIRLGGITNLRSLAPSAVQAALGKLRESGLSLRSVNRGLRAAKSFSRWLVRDGRMRDDPIAFLSAFNAETDRKRFRRALSDDEVRRVLDAAETGGTLWGLSGRDRAALYRIALATGYRASEIDNLTVGDFMLDGTPPVVRLAATHSKRRRDELQPIASAVADALRPWIAGRAQSAKAIDLAPPAKSRVPGVRRRLRTPLREVAAKMLRRDARTAGVELEGIDFHALRHSYVSRVVRSGVDVKTAQELARHSDPRLTIGRYTHARLEDKARALDSAIGGLVPQRIDESGDSRSGGRNGCSAGA